MTDWNESPQEHRVEGDTSPVQPAVTAGEGAVAETVQQIPVTEADGTAEPAATDSGEDNLSATQPALPANYIEGQSPAAGGMPKGMVDYEPTSDHTDDSANVSPEAGVSQAERGVDSDEQLLAPENPMGQESANKIDKEPLNFDDAIAEYNRVKNLPLEDPERQRVGEHLHEIEEDVWEKVRAENDDGESNRLARIATHLLDMGIYLRDGRDRSSHRLTIPYDVERLIWAVDHYNIIAEAKSIKEMLEESEGLNPKEAMGRGYDIAVQVAKNTVGSKRRVVNDLSNAEIRDEEVLEKAEYELDAAEELLSALVVYRSDVVGEDRSQRRTSGQTENSLTSGQTYEEWTTEQAKLWSN